MGQKSGQEIATDVEPIRGFGRGQLVLGECVQGRRTDGTDFLITSPIAHYSTARFTIDPDRAEVKVEPQGYDKSQRAVMDWLNREGLPTGGRLEVNTPLPVCQGFGTSSADITASLRAAANAWRRTVTPEDISGIAITIEPTDGSMYDFSVAYAHRDGKLLETLGPLPHFIALTVCDSEGVDTVEFEGWRAVEGNLDYTPADIRRLEQAWGKVRQAIQTQDVTLLGQACQVSAEINEKILPKPSYPHMHELLTSGVGEGLLTAHSGSAVALLLNPNQPNFRAQYEQAVEHIDMFTLNSWLEISNRGPTIIPSPTPSGLSTALRRQR